MNRRLLWKLCVIIAVGTVALFYAIYLLTSHTEEGMSFISQEHQHQLLNWGHEAEHLYQTGDNVALEQWLHNLQQQEQTWAAVVETRIRAVAGSQLNGRFDEGFNLGRNVSWKIHLYFADNPIMEVMFADRRRHFLIVLPDRMRPGLYWNYTRITLQIILPMIVLVGLSIVLYRHIMAPLRQLELATRAFSQGNLNVRVRQMLGKRNDELSELANTFDHMATRIGELIVSQRQLISDLSHELRTPLTRLDIAIENWPQNPQTEQNLERIRRESQQIRKLVEDTLALAWLENERPQLQQETLDLVDLIDVIADDAEFEFPGRTLHRQLPPTALLEHSNHRAVGQALENIIRNALLYTPMHSGVTVSLDNLPNQYQIRVCDQGPGIPDNYLEQIFQPFFRLDSSRQNPSNGFGLGLPLARRQLATVSGSVAASNLASGGLKMAITLPKYPLPGSQS